MRLQTVVGGFDVAIVKWNEHEPALSRIRRQVFIDEQRVPEALEWDGQDDTATHVLATDAESRPIGCGRLLPGGKIGRMAVLSEWRGKGVGRALLQALLAEARRQGMPEVRLSAQVYAMPFYQKGGFAACSDIYDDADIPHRDMVLRLSI